jgi:hypothetical protein
MRTTMYTTPAPPLWQPHDAIHHLDLAPLVIQFGSAGTIAWYEIGLESAAPDPRHNLHLPMGLRALPR